MEVRPTHLNIEITTKCTAGCYICPRKVIDRKNKDMDVDDILDIIQQGYEIGVRRIGLHLFGEPTMHPQYAGILYKIREIYPKPEIFLRGYTNGYGLSNPEIRKSIIDNMEELVISIDGGTDETMLQNRPGINPTILEDSIKKLIEENKDNTLNVMVRMTLTAECDKEKELFIERWKPFVGEPGKGIAFAKLSNYVGDDSIERVPIRNTIPCNRIFFHIVVSVDKDVLLCCEDALPSCVIGNLKGASLKDIWFGEKMNEIRRLHLENKSDNIKLCKECTYNSEWSFDYTPFNV